MDKVKIGIIGMGSISKIYCQNLTTVYKNTEVYACSDINRGAAEAAAATWGIPHVMDVDELLACEDIKIIVNLTVPKAHFEICRKALIAGKNVYTEKPLSVSLEEGKELLSLAKSKGLMLGSAPETEYGAGISTGKALIEQGRIGDIIGTQAHFSNHGDEVWHKSCLHLYTKGGGPIYDRGPYFFTALTYLAGGVEKVSVQGSTTFTKRQYVVGDNAGKFFDVEVPTYTQGIMKYKSGAFGSILLSFDLWGGYRSSFEIYGTKGTIRFADPIGFKGPVMLAEAGKDEFVSVDLINDREWNIRGFAVSDMAQCVIEGRTNNIASGEHACHVLDIMESFVKSIENDGETCILTTSM